MQQSSGSIGSLATALARAQVELINPEKSMVATIRPEGRGDEAFQFTLGALVFEKRRVSSSKLAGEFCPGIRSGHIDDADRCNARLRWLDAEQGRGLAVLDTPPEFSHSGDDEMLVKRIRRDLDSNPVVPENLIRPDSRDEAESAHHPMRCLRSSIYFGRLWPTRSSRSGGLNSRIFFFGINSTLH
jgi:hypothetical protein